MKRMGWWLTPEKFQGLPAWLRAGINAVLAICVLICFLLLMKKS